MPRIKFYFPLCRDCAAALRFAELPNYLKSFKLIISASCLLWCREGPCSNTTPVPAHASQPAQLPQRVSWAWEHPRLLALWPLLPTPVGVRAGSRRGGFNAQCSIMALDDSSLYSRTKSKLNPHQTRYKSTRRRSLPPDILLENDFKGKFQKNIRNIDPIHPRRTKKRPSIFSGRKYYFNSMLVQISFNLFGNCRIQQWITVRTYSVLKPKTPFMDRFNQVPFMLNYVSC